MMAPVNTRSFPFQLQRIRRVDIVTLDGLGEIDAAAPAFIADVASGFADECSPLVNALLSLSKLLWVSDFVIENIAVQQC